MLLNFSVDSLLLLTVNRLSGLPPQWLKILPAAMIGALYSGAALVPGFTFLGNSFWRLVCLCGMGVIAFGWNAKCPQRLGVFVLMSAALGGLALGLQRSGILPVILSAVGLYLLCAVSFTTPPGTVCHIPVVIHGSHGPIHISALRDTGNTLRDPLTGEQILIVGPDIAERLTGLTRAQLRSPADTMLHAPLPGLRLIPYSAVGKENGFLLAKRLRNVKIGTLTRDTMVAFAPDGLGKGSDEQALTGGTL